MVHVCIVQCPQDTEQVAALLLLPQIAAYSEVSIRELIKWVKYILLELKKTSPNNTESDSSGSVSGSVTGSTDGGGGSRGGSSASELGLHPVPEKLLSDTAFAVYAARFRTAEARTAVVQLLSGRGWPMPHVHVTHSSDATLEVSSAGSSRTVQIGGTSMQWQQADTSSGLDAGMGNLPEEQLRLAAAVHAAVKALAATSAFIQAHGVYLVQQGWLQHWFQQLQQQGVTSTTRAAWLGLYCYCSRFRHAAARSAIAATFAAHLGLPEHAAVAAGTACLGSGPSDVDQPLQQCLPGVRLNPVLPAKPFVLTARVLKAWQVIINSLTAAEPLLVVGRDGCGKSGSLRALAWLLGEELQQSNLTPGAWANSRAVYCHSMEHDSKQLSFATCVFSYARYAACCAFAYALWQSLSSRLESCSFG